MVQKLFAMVCADRPVVRGRVLFAFGLLLMCCFSMQATAQALERIVAVVNEDAITQRDVQERVSLLIANASLPSHAQMRQRLAPEALRGLIDEALELQEAKRLRVDVLEEDIRQAMAQVARQNNASPDQLPKLLAQRGVPLSALKKQIRANIAWFRVTQRRLSPMIDVGEKEIDEVMARVQASSGKTQYLLSEIFLPVDTKDQEDDVRRLAEKLVGQMTTDKGNFAAVARQFSQSSSAASGGDLGWVRQGQLGDAVDKALQKTMPGHVTPPVRDSNGYRIFAVRDRRVSGGAGLEDNSQPAVQSQPDLARATVKIHQIFLSKDLVKDQSKPDAALEEKAKAIRTKVKGCAAMAAEAAHYPHPLSGDAGQMKIKQLPAGMAGLVASLPIGKVGPSLTNSEGILLIMVCERHIPMVKATAKSQVTTHATGGPSREKVRELLMMDKLNMLQRRLLRDLRRSAFIEMRG